MILYILLRLFCKSVLAKLLLKYKKFMLTSINACYQKLIINCSLICWVHILLYILMSKSIICGMPLMFKLMSNVLNVYWSESNGQKKRVKWYLFFWPFDPLQHAFNTLLINLNIKDIPQMIDLVINVQRRTYT